MKHLFLTLGFLVLFSSSYADTSDNFKAYVGPGVGFSDGLLTYSMESGVWNKQVWIAGVAKFTPLKINDPVSNKKIDIWVGPKFYKRFATYQNVDFFLYGAIKGEITHSNVPLLLEPGACLVFNYGDHVGIQWSTSTSLCEGQEILKPFKLGTSICINWFF